MSITTSRTDSAQLDVRSNRFEQDVLTSDERSTPSAQRSRGKTFNYAFSYLPPLVLGLIILLAWYLASASGSINAFILPGPKDVFASLIDGFSSGLYWIHIGITVQESFLGFCLAVVVALPLGYGIAKSRLVASTLQPYMAAGQAIPAIVLAQFLYLWVGMGVLPVIIICMLVVVFPMIVNTVLGVQTIEHELLDAARLEGASGWSLLVSIEFPLALPLF